MPEYIKQKSVPRVKDEVTNRGLDTLDEELEKVSRVINANTKKAFELDSNEDYMPVEGRFFDPYFEEDTDGAIIPRNEVIFQLDSEADLEPA